RLWSYWKAQLAGDLEILNLPADRLRPLLQTFRGDSRPVSMSLSLTEALRSLGQKQRTTLFGTLQAAFYVLLHRYTAQEDILVGVPTVGRSTAELAGLIGYFVNPVVLRADLSGKPTFSEFLERVQGITQNAIKHQDYPFALLVERLQMEREQNRPPLFQVMFAFQKAPSFGEGSLASQALIGGARLSFGGVLAESISLRRRAAHFDLSLSVVETDAGLKGYFEYNTDLFDEWRIERMAGHWRTLLEAVIADPMARIHVLELMNEGEKRQIIEEWNETKRGRGSERLVPEMIAEHARRRRDAIAVKSYQGELSYGELNRRSNQLARYLRRLGVRPEVVVGICLERSVEMIVAVLGVLKAGGAYLPLDPESPPERLRYMLEDAGARIVLTQQELYERPEMFEGLQISLDTAWEKISKEQARNLGNRRGSRFEAENLAYVIYTSGSTGRPKGVMATHQGLINLVEAQIEAFRLGTRSRVLQFASLSFDASVWEIFATLAAGGSLHVYGRESLMPGEDLARVLREDRITTVTLPPTVLSVMRAEELPDLETVIAAGEACTAEIVERWARGRRFYDAYGPTEATVCASMGECEAGRDERPSIGRPLANTRVYILDGELEPAPVGVRGELYIAGAGVTRGYVGRPEQTAERFIPNGFDGGGRLYRTGDIARYLADGRIDYLGRADEQVKLRGYRIELGEIEAVLKEHGSVRQSVVVMREEEEGDRGLLGYVVGEGGVTGAELKKYLRERLPEYMVPEAILVLEEMPVTANGKIDRKKLSMVPTPKEAGRQIETEYMIPQTLAEEIVAGILKEVLKLDRVGIYDNFFELGGHSLLATRVASRIRGSFGVEIGVKSIFEEPTVAELARRVEEAMRKGEKDEAPPLVRVSRDGRLPLSFAQQRLWFIDQLNPGSAAYNMPGALRLEGRLEIDVL
ncbi:MAG: amino acid adenylation domain-containing protein, partial [Ktedonobacteraceae bacterium]|nr:amino acid adenylation domain-containing protein [Ktedonobacteraceae bacterium]